MKPSPRQAQSADTPRDNPSSTTSSRLSGWREPRVQARIALGICAYCNEESALAGRQWCQRCSDRHKAKARARYAERRQPHAPSLIGIRESRVKYRRQIRAERIARGECLDCGSPVKLYRRCTICRGLEAARMREARQRRLRAKAVQR